jgi:hypothetical protein
VNGVYSSPAWVTYIGIALALLFLMAQSNTNRPCRILGGVLLVAGGVVALLKSGT